MLKYVRASLVGFLGETRNLADVTEGDADLYREHLRKTLSENTVRTHCNRARQFFHAAIKHQLIEVNPFGGMGGLRTVEVAHPSPLHRPGGHRRGN